KMSFVQESIVHHFRFYQNDLSYVAAKRDRDLCNPSSPDFLTFEDPQALKVKSVWELIRALGVFRLCSFPALVHNCSKVRLMTIARKVLGQRCFCMVVRPSVYAQFVAGETEGELAGGPPHASVPIEEDLGESTGERRYEDSLAAMLDKNPMMQLKITALVSPELCYDPSMEGERTKTLALGLSGMLCLKVTESGNLVLDAIQTSIDHSFCLGVKLIRGAYMDKERRLAEKEARTDPIHESWARTNDTYFIYFILFIYFSSQRSMVSRCVSLYLLKNRAVPQESVRDLLQEKITGAR
uniref:Proline dehydrogenase n=1 Tax=Sinocyclocheilus rhinocerous TaxID=307959 RepID=A0A673KC69_9TELE